MIRIILVSGLAIGTATGGALALALAHDGFFARGVTPADGRPLTANTLPEPAPMGASDTTLTAVANTEWKSSTREIYHAPQEAVSAITSEYQLEPYRSGLITLSTSGQEGTMPAESAEGIDASLAEFDGLASPYAIELRGSDRTGPTGSYIKRSVDFSPLSTGVYR